MAGKASLVSVEFRYSNGRSYVIEGEELEVFMDYVTNGLILLASRGWDMGRWNSLVEKILRSVGVVGR